MDNIRVDIGVYTPIEIDLSSFDFTGISKVILTVKNMESGTQVLTRDFTTAAVQEIMITPTEAALMREDTEYDFVIETTDGKKYKNGDNGKIILRQGCGQWQASQSS